MTHVKELLENPAVTVPILITFIILAFALCIFALYFTKDKNRIPAYFLSLYAWILAAGGAFNYSIFDVTRTGGSIDIAQIEIHLPGLGTFFLFMAIVTIVFIILEIFIQSDETIHGRRSSLRGKFTD